MIKRRFGIMLFFMIFTAAAFISTQEVQAAPEELVGKVIKITGEIEGLGIVLDFKAHDFLTLTSLNRSETRYLRLTGVKYKIFLLAESEEEYKRLDAAGLIRENELAKTKMVVETQEHPERDEIAPTNTSFSTRSEFILQAEGFYFNSSGLFGSEEIIPGYPKTSFDAQFHLGGALFFRRSFQHGRPWAISLGIKHTPIAMDLVELGSIFGTLRLKPWQFNVRIESAAGFSPNGNGYFYYLELGCGYTSTAFSNGPFLESLTKATGILYNVSTKSNVLYELAVGGMAYIYPFILTTSIGYLGFPGDIKCTWTASSPGGSIPIEQINRFRASGLKFTFGIGISFLRISK